MSLNSQQGDGEHKVTFTPSMPPMDLEPEKKKRYGYAEVIGRTYRVLTSQLRLDCRYREAMSR